MTNEDLLSEKYIKKLFKKFIVALLKAKPTEIKEMWELIEKMRRSLSETSSQNKMVRELAKAINDLVEILSGIAKSVWVLRIHRIAILIFLSAIIIAVLGTVFYLIGKTNLGMFLVAMCGILLGVAGILISIFSIMDMDRNSNSQR